MSRATDKLPSSTSGSSSASVLSVVGQFVRDNAVLLGGAAVLIVGGLVLLRQTAPKPIFRDADDETSEGASDAHVRFVDDAALPSHMTALVRASSSMNTIAVYDQMLQAIHELHAEGVFAEDEAAVIGRDFAGLARASSTAQDMDSLRLTRKLCRFVFAKVGVADEALADRIYDTWNTDGEEGIDMKEFLHAVVLVLRGAPSEKLDLVFRIMDSDGDGWVSKRELLRFLSTVYRSSGQKRSLDAISAQVDRMMAEGGKTREGMLSRKEFISVANDAKFHVGETLVKFLHDLTARFSEGMAGAADEYRAARGATGGEKEEAEEDEAASAAPPERLPLSRGPSVYK